MACPHCGRCEKCGQPVPATVYPWYGTWPRPPAQPFPPYTQPQVIGITPWYTTTGGTY